MGNYPSIIKIKAMKGGGIEQWHHGDSKKNETGNEADAKVCKSTDTGEKFAVAKMKGLGIVREFVLGFVFGAGATVGTAIVERIIKKQKEVEEKREEGVKRETEKKK